MKAATLTRLQAGRAAGRCMVLLTDLADGAQALLGEGEAAATGALSLTPAMLAAAEAAMQQEASGIVEADGRRLFVHVFAPPPRLIVVGAVHIAKPLLRLAALADYRAVLVDPRRAFAAQDGFAAATVIDAWPDEALAAVGLDRRTAVVTLTHDPKLDDAALQAALASPAFYLGALGSRKTHAARLARLAAQGFGEADLARIRGPVGLAIGAATPAEIAIAIIAEITRVRRQAAREQVAREQRA